VRCIGIGGKESSVYSYDPPPAMPRDEGEITRPLIMGPLMKLGDIRRAGPG